MKTIEERVTALEAEVADCRGLAESADETATGALKMLGGQTSALNALRERQNEMDLALGHQSAAVGQLTLQMGGVSDRLSEVRQAQDRQSIVMENHGVKLQEILDRLSSDPRA